MGWQDDPIVSGNAPTTTAPWEKDPVAYPAAAPREAHGLIEAAQAGWQGSATGLAARGKLPDVQLSSTDNKWYERLAASGTQMAAELPLMVAGGIGGAAAGTAVAPGVGTVIGGGAGSFALPAAIRESYIQAYKGGEIQSAGDFLNRAAIVLKQTGKEAVVGGATAGMGRFAKIGAETAGLSARAVGLTALGAEGATMTVTPALLDGRLPEPQDFLDAAVMLGGLKAAGVVSHRLADVYAKTGKTPVEVMADAKADPTIAEDLVKPVEEAAPANDVPRAYEELARAENDRNAIPDPSPEAKQFIESPFSKVPQLPGEPALSTHVNYNYLNTFDDVKGAMSRLSELYENDIKQATRGTVPWEQTYQEARDLYQKTTGEAAPDAPLTNADYAKLSADLYARKQILVSGAEQLMDLRSKYAEAKATGVATDQMKLEVLAQIDRVAQAQAAVRGSQAEVGRALNILKSNARDKAYYDQLTDIINGRFGVEGTKIGDANFDTMVEMMGKLGTPEEALKFAEKAAKATTWQKVVEAWKAGLVSGPFTQIANIMGNGTFMATRPLVDAVAAAVGKATGNAERVNAVEPLARVIGNIHGVLDGSKAAWAVMSSGEGMTSKTEAHGKAIEGKLGEVIRTPFRLLSGVDAFFRVTNERGEAYSLAAREATKEGYNPATREFRDRVIEIATNPTDKMQEAIDAAGVRFTFNAPLGEKGQAVQKLIRTAHLEWAVPFIQTPANVFKEMARLTPAAPIVAEWRADFEKGGAARDKALAEVAMGTALGTAVFSLAVAGNISGQGDPDPRKRAVQMASGWQPYSIKLGNKWYSYQRLQPIGTLIGMAADMATVWDHLTPDESDKIPKILTTAFANSVTNQTFLQGVTNIVNAMSDPERFGPRFVQNMASSVVPALIGQTNQMLDPYQREVNSVWDAVQARLPGLSQSLTPKRDPYGEPLEQKDRVLGISPVTTSTMSQDKVRLEAARLGVGASKAPDHIELPAGKDKKLGKVELTPQQQDVFADVAGHHAHQILEQMVNSPSWDQLPDMVQRNAINTVFERSRKLGQNAAVPPEQIRSEAVRIAKELQIKLQQK